MKFSSNFAVEKLIYEYFLLLKFQITDTSFMPLKFGILEAFARIKFGT